MTRPIFNFDTTHHALWSEELAKGAGVAHEIVPAPPEADARCSIALETLPEDVALFEGVLRSAGVNFRLFHL
jgi:hypothetical protein